MAEQPQNFGGASSPNLVPYKDDFDVMKGMTVPETIKVSEDSNMNGFGGGNVGFQGTTSMSVPERIVLDGGAENEVEGRSDVARELQGNGVNLGSYMGGMVTPPRTLTVDDTTSRYREETRAAGTAESRKGVKTRRRKNIDEKYAVSVGERLFPDASQERESDDDISDFRLQTEIVRLNKRVAWLEKKVQERQSNSSWRTTLVCLLTIINPIIIHWLFSKRRY